MDKCKAVLLENGEIFLSKASEARSKIARLALPWISSQAVRAIFFFSDLLLLLF